MKILKAILNFIKGVFKQIWMILDSIKGVLIVVLIALFILFLMSLIVHNVLRFGEISVKYTGEYKNLYSVKDKMMNVYVTGEGEETILILSGFAVSSPTMEYKAIAEELGKNYRVVIVEYFGYGFSLSMKDERTNENIINEVRDALSAAEISGPFILMPFDISNIYAMYYAKQYPSEVTAIVSIDGMYPMQIEKSSFRDDYLPNYISNVNFYSAIGLTGVFRWETYLEPEKFNIDKLEQNDAYGENEVKLYRRLLANKFLTSEMRREIKQLDDNMKEMKDYIYPEDLLALQIITKDTLNEYVLRGEDMDRYATDLISNKSVQRIQILDGNLDTYLFEEDKEFAAVIKEHLKTIKENRYSQEDEDIIIEDNFYDDENESTIIDENITITIPEYIEDEEVENKMITIE